MKLLQQLKNEHQDQLHLCMTFSKLKTSIAVLIACQFLGIASSYAQRPADSSNGTSLIMATKPRGGEAVEKEKTNLAVPLDQKGIRNGLESAMRSGGESGGGGNSNPATAINENGIRNRLEYIHHVAEFSFNPLFTHLSPELNLGQTDPGAYEVLQTIRREVNRDPTFFNKLKLAVYPRLNSCAYNGQSPTIASYHRGTICFDLTKILQLGYGPEEADIYLASLYAHEVGHAAGYDSSVASEEKLADFQKFVEVQLRATSFSSQDYLIHLQHPLSDTDFGIVVKLNELVKRGVQSRRSRSWNCWKLQALTNHTTEWVEKLQAFDRGLSLIPWDKTEQLELFVDEASILAGLNCDGADTENLSALSRFKGKPSALKDVLLLIDGANYCDPKMYANTVCEAGSSTIVATRRLSNERFNETVFQLASRLLRFFETVPSVNVPTSVKM